MAENKTSFVLYADNLPLFEKLSDENAGQLIKHILRYVNDRNPITDNPLVEIAFEPIKQQLKRDLKKWEETKESKSESGGKGNLKRWHPDLYKQVIEETMSLDDAIKIAKSRKHRTSDKTVANIAVNVNDSVSVSDNGKKTDGCRIDQLKIKLLAEHEYIDVCVLQNRDQGLAKENINEYLDRFIQQISDGPAEVSFTDKKKHFRSWLRKHLSFPENRPQVSSGKYSWL